jgi:indolepyruvate ferredoxin oxidoreductase
MSSASAVNVSKELRDVSLDDKWDKTSGPVLITGNQAIVRALLAQADLDQAAGLKTGGFVSGYRGSPLGGLDNALWSVRARLAAANIHFRPGVNEELAATSVSGSQQVGLLPGPNVQGVFAAWYGKGPGVDRALDSLKHGNYRGASSSGGVVCFYGDDHGGKSSTVAHQSEQAMASCLIPSLYPSDVGEIFRFTLLGYALSRYSGAWVGLKCVNETVEQTMTVDLKTEGMVVLSPDMPVPPEGLHARYGAFNPARDEEIALDTRLERVKAFVRANRLDREVFRAERPALGLIAAGKSYGDTQQALQLLGLDGADADAFGLSLYKVGCIWPLEPSGLTAFAKDHAALLVIEEKKSFLEQQAAELLVNWPDAPSLYGKRDEEGGALLSRTALLEPLIIADAIVGRLAHLGFNVQGLKARLPETGSTPTPAPSVRRSPYFCSGCPHNRSTRLPEGSLSMTGIGCHAMVNFVRPDEALPAMQMGGEGASWIGMAPFSSTQHIFQNLGDGTYYHSGLLAIRAAVAAGVNITYKILYNDAVAMTGGQPVDGPISVDDIARQTLAEGAQRVVVVTDGPERYSDSTLPPTVAIKHRDDLDEVQRELREVPGVTVLIYEQTCAAEKRRRRKRGQFPDPPQRMFIAQEVCEGCGDCSVQSTCVSLQPIDTPFGVKRRIDQASCNKDFSCLNGFCPSFITVRGAEPRKASAATLHADLFDELPAPAVVPAADIMVAGIGGTGVVTAAAILGMAAHLQGKSASLYDMTGLAQKNGAVYSHVRIAEDPQAIPTQRIGRGQADVLLAFDLVAALGLESAAALAGGKTAALVNSDVAATAAFQFNRDAVVDRKSLLAQLEKLVDKRRLAKLDATALASNVLGDAVFTTSLLLGAASQLGLLPVTPAALEEAMRQNGVAIEGNLRAFRLGRLAIDDRRRTDALLQGARPAPARLPTTLAETVALYRDRLTTYQGRALAERYETFVDQVANRARLASIDGEALAMTVARQYGRLLSYKDEYEVARLLSDPKLYDDIRRTFGDGARLAFNMAPPLIPNKVRNGRPAKREFSVRLRPLLRLLAGLKGLRGTWADPFGQTSERRMERMLIVEYEALVERVLAILDTSNQDRAVAVLGLVQMVRGYGPVKAEAVATYRRQVSRDEAQLQTPAFRISVPA